jgi:hypothetical protein
MASVLDLIGETPLIEFCANSALDPARSWKVVIVGHARLPIVAQPNVITRDLTAGDN